VGFASFALIDTGCTKSIHTNAATDDIGVLTDVAFEKLGRHGNKDSLMKEDLLVHDWMNPT
jgi:hypothetical protein